MDTSLYGSLRQTLENVDVSNLTWRDLEASMVISDDSFMVKNLGSLFFGTSRKYEMLYTRISYNEV